MKTSIVEIEQEQRSLDLAGFISEGAKFEEEPPVLIIQEGPDFHAMQQEIETLKAKCSEYVDSLLKTSTLIELFKQDEAKLKAEIAKIKNERDFLNECFDKTLAEQNVERAFLDVFLDEQEAIWDRTKELSSYEIAVHYLAAAQHRRNQGRSGDRIQEIQNWIDSNGQPV